MNGVTARYVTVVPLSLVAGGVTPGTRVVVGEDATVAAGSHLAAIDSVDVVVLVFVFFVVRTVTGPRTAVQTLLCFIE